MMTPHAVAARLEAAHHDASSSCLAARQLTLATGRAAGGLLWPGSRPGSKKLDYQGIEQTEGRCGRCRWCCTPAAMRGTLVSR